MAHLIKYYPTSSLIYSKNSYPNDFAFVGLTKIPSHVYKISYYSIHRCSRNTQLYTSVYTQNVRINPLEICTITFVLLIYYVLCVSLLGQLTKSYH